MTLASDLRRGVDTTRVAAFRDDEGEMVVEATIVEGSGID
jgi:hypothetical protein